MINQQIKANLTKQFRKNGYFIVKNLFKKKTINKIIKLCDSAVDFKKNDMLKSGLKNDLTVKENLYFFHF